MHLPQEIIDYIVDYVYDSPSTLATLRRLNHAWNISATLHLFRTIKFDLQKRPLPLTFRGIDRSKVLLTLLESSTETISHCVRHCIFASHPFKILTECQQNDYAVLILSIVSRFTHMSEIEFSNIKWSTLTPSFSSCIIGICKSPTLERLNFWYCSMPTVSTFLDILQASSNLKTLRLYAFKIVPDSKRRYLTPSSSENQYCSNITTPLLHSLTIHAASDRILHVFKVDMLKQLRWNILPDNASGAEFLKSVGQSLESLGIHIVSRSSTFKLRLDLSHCPRLQHLRISGLIWSLEICPSTYFCSLFAQTPDQPPPIECLKLMVEAPILGCTDEETSSESAGLHPDLYQHQCQTQCRHDDDNIDDYDCGRLCHSGWLTLDDSLSRSRIFQSLKTLEISIQQFGERVLDLSGLCDTFPNLKNKGVEVVCTYLDEY